MVIGIVLLIVASAGIVLSMVQLGGLVEGLPDPEGDALEKLSLDEAGSRTVELEEGEYEVWREEGDDIGALEVKGEEGNSVFERHEGRTITIDRPDTGERSYEKVGNLDIDGGGAYTFQTDERCTLYVVESSPFLDSFTSILSWITVIGGSATLAVAGGLLLFLSLFDRKDCPYCGETISKDSLRCGHCNRDLTRRTSPSRPESGYR